MYCCMIQPIASRDLLSMVLEVISNRRTRTASNLPKIYHGVLDIGPGPHILHSHKKCYNEADPSDPLSLWRFLLQLEAGLQGDSQWRLATCFDWLVIYTFTLLCPTKNGMDFFEYIHKTLWYDDKWWIDLFFLRVWALTGSLQYRYNIFLTQ